jgi:hypothetical protein
MACNNAKLISKETIILGPTWFGRAVAEMVQPDLTCVAPLLCRYGALVANAGHNAVGSVCNPLL